MKFIVIGASGFVGSHLITMIHNKGYQCLGTQYSASRSDLIQFDLLTQRVTDVLPKSFLNQDEPIYAVICSSLCKLNDCYYNHNLSYELNVTKTIQLLSDLKNIGIKFAFISSDLVFDGQVGYYNEKSKTSPVNEYGRQKLAVEEYIQGNHPRDLIFRLSKVVGDLAHEEHFFSDCYKKVLQKLPIRCIKGQMFSPTDVKDVALGVIKGFELNLSGLYHLTNSEYFYRDELAKQFILTIGEELEVQAVPLEDFGFPEKRSMKTYLDGTRFSKETGIHFTTMREVMDQFVERNIKI